MWYMYTTEYYPAIKKNEIMPSVETWMDLEIIILSEVCQTQKDKYIISHICRKIIQMNLFLKQTHRHKKQPYGYPLGKVERGKLGIWD